MKKVSKRKDIGLKLVVVSRHILGSGLPALDFSVVYHVTARRQIFVVLNFRRSLDILVS